MFIRFKNYQHKRCESGFILLNILNRSPSTWKLGVMWFTGDVGHGLDEIVVKVKDFKYWKEVWR